jgi:hypothetical protein
VTLRQVKELVRVVRLSLVMAVVMVTDVAQRLTDCPTAELVPVAATVAMAAATVDRFPFPVRFPALADRRVAINLSCRRAFPCVGQTICSSSI